NARGEADVMQQAVAVIEAEQQRAHRLPVSAVAKAPDHAIGAAVVLDFLHGGALARPVRAVAALGDDAVECRTGLLEPVLGLGDRLAGRRQTNTRVVGEITSR